MSAHRREEERAITVMRDKIIMVHGADEPDISVQPKHRAIFKDAAVCDGCGYEMTLYTDGLAGYALSTVPTAYEQITGGSLLRVNEQIRAYCGQSGRRQAECHGTYEWNLDEPGTWTADPEAIELLTEHGKPMEVRP